MQDRFRLRGYSILRGFAGVCLCLLALPAAFAAEENPFRGDPAAVADGRKIYNDTCTACHGVDGGPGERGPALGDSGRRYARRTDEEMFDAIIKGIPGTEMPAMGLSDENAWKIAAYLDSLRAVAAEAEVPGDSAQGSEIFWKKGECGRCHMVRGRGGLLGPDLSNLGGERPLSNIRESLTVAKLQPPRGFRPVELRTRDGRHIQGIAKNESNFSLQILSDQGELHLFEAAEIAELTYAKTSLMPTDYDRRLSETEFQDLLAFLSRQVRESPDPPLAR